jgi:hypothetical protein
MPTIKPPSAPRRSSTGQVGKVTNTNSSVGLMRTQAGSRFFCLSVVVDWHHSKPARGMLVKQLAFISTRA